MSAMSRNGSNGSLMGFSVHQPAIGAPLQFFPSMGSQQLDEMIDAYVPTPASILEKRAAVSVEFFSHTIKTGELFKFFLVYPHLAASSTSASPASSSQGMLQDSGYGSSFNASPVLSENQWIQTSYNKKSQSSVRKTSKKAVSSQSNDFSNMPGMKIMTKDGQDVTNTASRGCKTKEQRDHAHLMRVLKACDSCKKKKVRCDPSHKKRAVSHVPSPESKVTKKTKKTASLIAPKIPIVQQEALLAPVSFDSTMPESSSVLEGIAAPDNWDQFMKYDEEPTSAVPYDFDLFFDQEGHFSPTTNSGSTSVSPTSVFTPAQSQPITPVGNDYASGLAYSNGLVDGDNAFQQPTLPYLNPGGADVRNSYVDFNLYSPGSTGFDLEEDPAFSNEIAAPHGSHRSYVPQSLGFPTGLGSHELTSPTPHTAAIFDSTMLVNGGTFDGLFSGSNDRTSHSTFEGTNQVSGISRRNVNTSDALAPSALHSPIPVAQAQSSSSESGLVARVLSSHTASDSIKNMRSPAQNVGNTEHVEQPVSIGTNSHLFSSNTVEDLAIHDSPHQQRRRPILESADTENATINGRHTPEVSTSRETIELINFPGTSQNNAAVKRHTSPGQDGAQSALVKLPAGHSSPVDSSVEYSGDSRNQQSNQRFIAQGHLGTHDSVATAITSTGAKGISSKANHGDMCATVLNMVHIVALLWSQLGVQLSGKPAQRVYSVGFAQKVPLDHIFGLVSLNILVISSIALGYFVCRDGPLIDSIIMVVSLIAFQKNAHQNSLSCMNKMDPFMQVLRFARQMPSDAIDNVKSKIHGFQRGISNLQCRILTASSRQTRISRNLRSAMASKLWHQGQLRWTSILLETSLSTV